MLSAFLHKYFTSSFYIILHWKKKIIWTITFENGKVTKLIFSKNLHLFWGSKINKCETKITMKHQVLQDVMPRWLMNYQLFGQAGLRAINLHISVSFGTATLGLPEPEHGGTVLLWKESTQHNIPEDKPSSTPLWQTQVLQIKINIVHTASLCKLTAFCISSILILVSTSIRAATSSFEPMC